MSATTDRITKTPGVCGGDACIRGMRIPVWVLVGYRRLGQSDPELLRAYPSLTAADLAAAREYAAANAEEIDRAIRENEEGGVLMRNPLIVIPVFVVLYFFVTCGFFSLFLGPCPHVDSGRGWGWLLFMGLLVVQFSFWVGALSWLIIRIHRWRWKSRGRGLCAGG